MVKWYRLLSILVHLLIIPCSSKYPLSAKLECGECGTKFRRHCQQHGEKKVIIWVCIKHQLHSNECSMRPIKENVIKEAFINILKELVSERNNIISELEQSIKIIIENNPIKDSSVLEKELNRVERQAHEKITS